MYHLRNGGKGWAPALLEAMRPLVGKHRQSKPLKYPLSWILNFTRTLNRSLPIFQFINRFYLTSLRKTVLNHLCFSSEHPMITSKGRLLNLGVTMEILSWGSESVHFSKPPKCSCFKMSSLVNLFCLVLKYV